MADGLPNEHSVFERRTIQDVYQEIHDVYRRFPQPWVIGYCGGKDSITVLQLIWKALILQHSILHNKCPFWLTFCAKPAMP